MRIIIDGDGCCNIDIILDLIVKYNIESYLFCDTNHLIKSDIIKIIMVDESYQNVDMKISNFAKNNDIIITQDYGLACLLINKCKIINPKGIIYTKQNIDFLLENRHLNLKNKNNPKKLTFKDKNIFKNNLENLIISNNN